VSGIHEWARRIRELRVEQGWPIHSHKNDESLKPGQYILTDDEPNEALANAWRTANRIRNLEHDGKPVGVRPRLLEYFKAIYPNSVDKEQLSYIANGSTAFPRRIRELAEAGWRISSSNDDGSLRPGSYRLDSLTRGPARPREAIKLRASILDRDCHICQDCGRRPKLDGVRLQVHHLHEVASGGSNDPDNLVTLCTDCHAGRHSLSPGATDDELLNPAADPDSDH